MSVNWHIAGSRLDKLLDDAVALHQAGNLAAADTLYREALAIDRQLPGALYGAGVVAHQLGRNGTAIELLDAALRHRPDEPAWLNMRGLVYAAIGRIEMALGDFQRAIRLKPDFAEAYNSIGVTLRKQDRIDEAIEYYRQAIEFRPDLVMAHNNLGNALKSKGDLGAALTHYRHALTLQPDFVEAINNLGTVYTMQGALDEARVAFERVLQLRPEYPDALNNLGAVYQKRGDIAAARQCFERALQISPGFAAAHANLASVLNAQEDFYNAIESCRQALEIAPEFPEAYFNLGIAFKDLGLPLKALKYFETAVKLRPTYAGAYNGIANICRDQGQFELAGTFYREAFSVDPTNHEVHSNLLFTMSHHVMTTPEALLEAHRDWAASHCHEGRAHRYTHSPATAHGGHRLRIGYVSPDFRRHAAAFFLEPLLAAHDRRVVEIYCYAELGRTDQVTARFRQSADAWRDTAGMSDTQLARQIVDDRIDILVDLAGHTAGNRLTMFAFKPAPVQATYLGYCATTGLEEIDYWISDDVIHPADTRELAVESILRLPRCWVSYQTPVDAPAVQVPQHDHVTFGCFNDRSKICAEVVGVWSRILERVAGSRLILKARQYADADINAELASLFRQHGIDAARIEFQPLSLPEEYFSCYHAIDIALDPFPRHGGVTTADALWMGVPVVTLIGERFIERHGASLLAAIGAQDWIAQDPDHYIEIAVALAADPGRRRVLRLTQRQRMRESPLCDPQGLARAMEGLYRRMWRHYVESAHGSTPAC